jgi:hypothetical protein
MRSAALSIALLLVLSGATSAVAASGGAVDAASPPDRANALSGPTDIRAQTDAPLEETPETVIRIDLNPDRSAEWRVDMTYELETDNETRAFERLSREYETGASDVGVDEALFEQIADRAGAATGREMEIQNATYNASVREDTGTLSVSFVWTNFLGETENGDLALGDVFYVPNEDSETTPTWLSIVGDDQRVIIEPPSGYATNTTSIPVKQQNNAITLEGTSTFEDEDALVVTYRRTGSPSETQWPLVVGGGVVVLLLLVLAGVVLRGRVGVGAGPSPTTAGGSNPGSGNSRATNGGNAPTTPPPIAEEETEEDTTVEDGDETADESDEPEVDLSLLSDEERVEYLLEERGGRMKQANIVKETGWSDAKVSQLLSSMAEDGRVDKLRLGRENLISLPGESDDEDE